MMPMSWEKTQSLLVNEIVFEFLAIVQNQNEINRGREDAKPGVVQTTGNQILDAASATLEIIPAAGKVASIAITLANLGWNFWKDSKHEKRRAGVNAEVIQNLNTWLHDEVKKAAILLSLCFREYLEKKLHPKSIKVLADCIAERMFNHMSKVANEESEADVWFSEELIRGAFEGISGRLKKTVRSTALETQEEAGWMKTMLHYHIPTVEGLLTHTPFATKDENGQWVYYASKTWDKPLEKYGLAIFPQHIAQMRLKAKGRFGEQYTRFEPQAADITPRQEEMTVYWEELAQPIVFTPTESNETLSEKQAQHEQSIEAQELRITSFEDVLSTIGISLETLENNFLELKKQHAQNNQELQRFLKKQHQKELWEKLIQAPIPDEATYYADVDEWLSDLAHDTDKPATAWIECLVRASLEEYTAVLKVSSSLVLSPWEKVCCTLTEADKTLIRSTPKFFPLKKTPDTHRVEWIAPELKYYFLSIGLWQLYQSAKALKTGEHSHVWQNLPFQEPLLQRFLTFWKPQEVAPHLLEDWQVVDEAAPAFKQNINQLFNDHPTSCPCHVCQGRLHVGANLRKEHERIETARKDFLLPGDEIRWMRVLDVDTERDDFHPGFSPHQPEYLNRRNFALSEWSTDEFEQLLSFIHTHSTSPALDNPLKDKILALKSQGNDLFIDEPFDDHETEALALFLENLDEKGKALKEKLFIRQNHFQAVAWHWPEEYLSHLLMTLFRQELDEFDEKSHNHLISIVPAAINEHLTTVEDAQWEDEVTQQLLKDQLDYIQSMLQWLTLEDEENIDANRWFATYEDAYKAQSVCHEEIKQRAKIRYKETFKEDCPLSFKEALSDILDEESPLLDTTFLSLQDGQQIASVLDERIRMKSADSTGYRVYQNHRQSSYVQPGDSRKSHLDTVIHSWKSTLQAMTERKKELNRLNAGLKLDERWRSLSFSATETKAEKIKKVKLILHFLIEALELRELVIRNYMQGSKITQADFTPEEWEKLHGNDTMTTAILKRQKTSPGTSPLEISRESMLSERLTNHGFKRAATPYEVAVREQQLLQGAFWVERGKKYEQTALYLKGKSWEETYALGAFASIPEAGPEIGVLYLGLNTHDKVEYQTHLTPKEKVTIDLHLCGLSDTEKAQLKTCIREGNISAIPLHVKMALLTATEKSRHTWKPYKAELTAVLETLPSVKPILAHRLGREKTKILEADLKAWEQRLVERQRQLQALLEQYHQTQKKQRQERYFHDLSHQMRFEKLLEILPPLMKAAYHALSEENQHALMKALKQFNRQPVAEWFCRAFNEARPQLFQQECEEALYDFFLRKIPAARLNLSDEELGIFNTHVNAKNFEAAYGQIKNPGISLKACFEAYKKECHRLLTRFQDTRAVWESLPEDKREPWILASFQGKKILWEEVLPAMEGKWYLLSHSLFKSFLCQGLHPDATYQGHTLLSLAMQSLYPENSEYWTADYARSLNGRFNSVYYLLYCEGNTHHWDQLLKGVATAYKNPHNRNRQDWLNLAAALILFKGFQKNPGKKTAFLNDLREFKENIKAYWDNFSAEEQSWLRQFFGSLFRKQTVRKNREETVAQLAIYVESIPSTIGHLYAFFDLLKDLMNRHEKQWLQSYSRLYALIKRLEGRLNTLLEDLKVWENMAQHLSSKERAVSVAESKQLVLANPAKVVTMPVGSTARMVAPFYTDLTYDSPEEWLKRTEEKRRRVEEEKTAKEAKERTAAAKEQIAQAKKKTAEEEKNEEAETVEIKLERLQRENQAKDAEIAALQEQLGLKKKPQKESSYQFFNRCTIM